MERNSIVVLATGWGTSHGGINSFNIDFCKALRRNISSRLRFYVVVPEATGLEKEGAKNHNIRLIICQFPDPESKEDPRGIVSNIIELLKNQGCGQVSWWFGHDVKTGPLASLCKEQSGEGLFALFQHMDFEAYQAIKTADGNIADEKKRQQEEIVKQADRVFGVGPLLTDAARRLRKRNSEDVFELAPGLQHIEEGYRSDNQFRAIIFGRMTAKDDRIKQGRLAAAAFAEFSKDARSQNESKQFMLTAFGFPEFDSEYEKEANELIQLVTERAGFSLNTKPVSYTENREELFENLVQSHVCLMLSIHEGFGLVGWEAIAARVPLIVSKQSGLHQLLVKHSLNGYVWGVSIDAPDKENLSEKDIKSIKDQLNNIHSNINNARGQAKRLYEELIRLDYTWDKLAIKCCRACKVDLLEPFVGLERIRSDRHSFFGGRSSEVSALVKKIKDGVRFLVIYGASGVGKSSLMDAGLLGYMREQAGPSIVLNHIYLRFSDDPFDSLADVLIKHGKSKESNHSNKDNLGDHLRKWPHELPSIIKSLLSFKQRESDVFIAIDQLEELFTKVSEANRSIFLDMLAKASESEELRIHVIVTIREDYFGFLSRYENLTRVLNRGHFAVGPIKKADLADAISKPLLRAGWDWDEGLPEKVSEGAGDDIGSLPLVALCMYALQQESISRKITKICIKDYDQLGGMRGIINRQAKKAEEILIADDKKLLDRFFYHLVRLDRDNFPVRRQLLVEKIQGDNELMRCVEVLVNQRLLVVSSIEQMDMVEIGHEILFDSWEKLSQWIEKNTGLIAALQKIELTIDIFERSEIESGHGISKLFDREDPKYIEEIISYLKIDGSTDEDESSDEKRIAFEQFFYGRQSTLGEYLDLYKAYKQKCDLVDAVVEGNTKQITKLLNSGVELHLEDVEEGRVDPVFYAAVTGDDGPELSHYHRNLSSPAYIYGRKLPDSLFDANNVYRTTKNGSMPIHLAAVSGQMAILRKLIKLGVNVDTPAIGSGGTSLQLVLSNGGDNKIVEFLLSYGADIRIASVTGWTPFLAAANGGSLNFLRKVEWTQDDIAMTSQGWNALHIASQRDSLDMVQYLINELNVPVNEKTPDGLNALHIAVSHNQYEIAQELMKLIDRNEADDHGAIPLMKAAFQGNASLCELLAEPGSVNFPDNLERNALIYAVIGTRSNTEEKIKTCQILIDAGASTNVKDLTGKNLLDHSEDNPELQRWFKDFVEEDSDEPFSEEESLPKTGIETEPKNEDDEPLPFAQVANNYARAFDPESNTNIDIFCDNLGRHKVHCLIDDRETDIDVGISELSLAEINAQDNEGITPLMMAAEIAEKTWIRNLLEKGALVEIEDDQGQTAIHHAAVSGDIETIEIFLVRGARVDKEDDYGVLPIHVACSHNRTEMIAYLSKYNDILSETNSGDTCLSRCSNEDSFELVRKIIVDSNKTLPAPDISYISRNAQTKEIIERSLHDYNMGDFAKWPVLPHLGVSWKEVKDVEIVRAWAYCLDAFEKQEKQAKGQSNKDNNQDSETLWKYMLKGLRYIQLPFYKDDLTPKNRAIVRMRFPLNLGNRRSQDEEETFYRRANYRCAESA